MRILYTSPHGVIIELDNGMGVRLVTTEGIIGPILTSPRPITKHLAHTVWAKDEGTNLEEWLARHRVEPSRLTDPMPHFG